MGGRNMPVIVVGVTAVVAATVVAVAAFLVGQPEEGAPEDQLVSSLRAEVEALRSTIEEGREQPAVPSPDGGTGPQGPGDDQPDEEADAPRRGDDRLNALDVEGVDCDGNGPDDLQGAIDQAVSNGQVLWIPETPDRCLVRDTLWLDDGTRIEAAEGAVVEAMPGFERWMSLVNIWDVDDITIRGGIWRMLHEGRDVFRVMSASDVTLADLSVVGAGFDGVYIGRSEEGGEQAAFSEGVTLERVLAHANLRLGVAIITGRDIEVRDSRMQDNGAPEGGHDPRRGLQVEPNHPWEILDGIRIVNLQTRGNPQGGVLIAPDKLEQGSDDIDLVVEHLDSEEEASGIGVFQTHVGGTIRIVEPRIHRSRGTAITLTNHWADGAQTEIVRPQITEWNTEPTGVRWQDSAISVGAVADRGTIGNVRISEATMTASENASDEAYYLTVDHALNPGAVEDVEFVDPVRLEGGQGLDWEGSGAEDRADDGGGDTRATADEAPTVAADDDDRGGSWFERVASLLRRWLPGGEPS